MNSIKAFLKAKGLYLVCLALVFAATITGIAAIRSVVRGVEDLTRIQKQALEEGTDVWDSPDAAVNQPAQDVPVATAQPSPAPSAAGSASSSLQQGAGQSGSASGGTGSSAASSAQQGTLPHAGWNGKVSQAFSGNTLVYNPTLGDWRTHNGTDYTAEQVTAVAAGTVTAIADDALWGRVVEVTDAQDRVWRYCGLEEVAVTQREKSNRRDPPWHHRQRARRSPAGQPPAPGMPQSRRLPGPGKELRQYRIILSADTASEVRQMPSQKRR